MLDWWQFDRGNTESPESQYVAYQAKVGDWLRLSPTAKNCGVGSGTNLASVSTVLSLSQYLVSVIFLDAAENVLRPRSRSPRVIAHWLSAAKPLLNRRKGRFSPNWKFAGERANGDFWSAASESPLVVSWDKPVIPARLSKCRLPTRADIRAFGHLAHLTSKARAFAA